MKEALEKKCKTLKTSNCTSCTIVCNHHLVTKKYSSFRIPGGVPPLPTPADTYACVDTIYSELYNLYNRVNSLLSTAHYSHCFDGGNISVNFLPVC